MAIFLGIPLLAAQKSLSKQDDHCNEGSNGKAASDDDPHRIVTDDMFRLD
jgi:hypothetical protein